MLLWPVVHEMNSSMIGGSLSMDEALLSRLLFAEVAVFLGMIAAITITAFPMRKRNGLRGLHDLLTQTRVVRIVNFRGSREVQPIGRFDLDNTLETNENHESVGHYQVLKKCGRTSSPNPSCERRSLGGATKSRGSYQNTLVGCRGRYAPLDCRF